MTNYEDRCTELELVLSDLLDHVDGDQIEIEGGIATLPADTLDCIDRARQVLEGLEDID